MNTPALLLKLKRYSRRRSTFLLNCKKNSLTKVAVCDLKMNSEINFISKISRKVSIQFQNLLIYRFWNAKLSIFWKIISWIWILGITRFNKLYLFYAIKLRSLLTTKYCIYYINQYKPGMMYLNSHFTFQNEWKSKFWTNLK